MKLRAVITITIYSILVILFSFWMAKQSYSWLPPEASAESKLTDDLFSLFTGLGTAVYFGTMGPFLYSLIFHRAGKYDMEDGPHIEGNNILEITWTATPLLIVLMLAAISYRTYEKMAIGGPMELVHLHVPQVVEPAYAEPFDSTPQQQIQEAVETEPIENIEVTARQWSWTFYYPKEKVTSTELHLPVDRRAKFTLRSEDVLHGFYIPAFRVGQYVVPNQEIEYELTPIKTGTYRLRDSMHSGTYFASNQADVVVQPLDEYERWLADAAAQTPSSAFNQAVYEYSQSNEPGAGNTKDKVAIRGWETIPPAPPPVVNFSPKHSPDSPATGGNAAIGQTTQSASRQVPDPSTRN
ncbi:cytochrome c oxidase subunit II [Leptolyngbya sp. FACHB-711]|uniref:cytochrome c oxidase subunit II n=1 Tax=unclassified Leptolyngbya TaxID=2650499 RepID=UPI0016826750|nr:cytochrome c oxidase subunit II [Leptolyngbya sp. FACHB-711]MBD2026676.1 cytochrome c oxidase subunit II [Leptolyngbya sp. FACHB-711]